MSGFLANLQKELGYFWGVFAPSMILPPPPTFSMDQIPDLTGRVALVTGAP